MTDLQPIVSSLSLTTLHGPRLYPESRRISTLSLMWAGMEVPISWPRESTPTFCGLKGGYRLTVSDTFQGFFTTTGRKGLLQLLGQDHLPLLLCGV
jgi:hypothetical protein